VVALVTLLSGAGCVGMAPPRPAAQVIPMAAAVAEAMPLANPADVEFINRMIHHHSQALVMSELAAVHASNPRIRTLAERIRVSQTDEIALMQLWLSDVGEAVPEPNPRMMGHGYDHQAGMPGMLTPEQLDQLGGARGAEFDRLFLTFMIQHHEGALDMVETLFSSHGGGVDDFIYKIASDTFADQGSEIDRMQRLLDALSGGR